MKPPSLALAITDAPRALVDAAVLKLSAPLLHRMPGAKGRHSVMVIPGFLGHDTGNGQLIRFLRNLGYHTIGWKQGRNLGSPFGQGHEQASNASRLYRQLNPGDPEVQLSSAPPPVPTTAIYTRADGIVNWRTSVQSGKHANVHNIEVLGSHIGLTMNSAVWYWVARKLREH